MPWLHFASVIFSFIELCLLYLCITVESPWINETIMEGRPDYFFIGRDWCKKEDIAPENAVLLVSEPIHSTTRQILTSLTRRFFPNLQGICRKEEIKNNIVNTLVLCEVKRGCQLNVEDSLTITIHHDQIEFRVIHLSEMSSQQPCQTSERLSVESLSEEMSGSNYPQLAPSQFSLVANYRKLKFFSGKTEIGKDEERWDNWIEAVDSQMEEDWCRLSDPERKRRIREVLRPPASDVIFDLRQDKPRATSLDYLTALETAFGSTESGEELYFQLHSLQQREGEKTSQFLVRLQKMIRRVIRKGGLLPDQAPAIRLGRFIKGTLYNELMVTSLRLRERERNPPGYIELLKEVRRYEEEQETKKTKREGIHGKGKRSTGSFSSTVLPKDDKQNFDGRLEKLEKEVSSLKLQSTFHPSQERRKMPEDPTTSDDTAMAPPVNYRQWTSEATRRPTPDFCFRCGELGHISRSCDQPEDLKTVNKKLIQFVLGNPRGRTTGGNRASDQV